MSDISGLISGYFGVFIIACEGAISLHQSTECNCRSVGLYITRALHCQFMEMG
jgi:hypothetical protein